MSKVVVTKLSEKRHSASSKEAPVAEKRMRDVSTGQLVTVRTLDGRSKSFGDDLTYVFKRNVAKARRDNKKVSGVTDRAPAKG